MAGEHTFLVHFQAPYLKAIDVWMITAVTFVIGTVIEFAVAHTVLRTDQRLLTFNRLKQLQLAEVSSPLSRRGSLDFVGIGHC